MPISRREFSLSLLGATALAGPALAQGASEADRRLTAFLDAQFEEEVRMDPEWLTRLGRKERYSELTDRSEAFLDRQLAWRRQSVAKMKAQFAGTKLSDEARTSYDMWALELERAETDARWRRRNYIFVRGGPQSGLPNFLINEHAVADAADMEAYVARTRAIGPALDQALVRARRAAAEGVRPPRFAFDQALEEVKRLTTGAPFDGGGDSALFADAKAKVAALRKAGKIDQARADRLLGSQAQAMTGSMKPAYERVAAWLTAEREKTTAEPQGAHALPNGRDYYQALVRLQTTTGMTPDQIHELGLSEVKRIRAEMETLKAKIGFTGSLEEFFAHMRTEKSFFLPNTEAGRATYLKAAEDYLAGIHARLPEQFGRLPKAPLIVKRVEAFREEAGGAAHYNSGAPEASRPGIFYVHLADMGGTPTFELEGTAYHEGWPGHHMQIMLAQEMTGQPAFRGHYGYGAYIEGWGLYSELLAKEMGFYKDPYSDFGRLGREIWRAIRLVVDTGLHHKGWSEAQALEFYTANSPQPASKIRSEIRRYLVNPGQATSYKVGMVKILELRARARQALGPRYDQKGFHEAVLGAGSLPLDILEARVDRWIASRRV
ncbi:DUF885 domain-containing protein [Phenylobacterium sp.]|jgi:uncharacterized protein (DUF885 family)|uniref:DUF885 domain-containing protein n=1 Tax=Phenylobacterium sp. TaxID=1871053 RepID=UPI002F92DBEF